MSSALSAPSTYSYSPAATRQDVAVAGAPQGEAPTSFPLVEASPPPPPTSDALSEVSPGITQGIAEGRTHAEALLAADEGGFALSGKGSRTHKEVFWHRAALERAPQLMDPPEAGADRTRAR